MLCLLIGRSPVQYTQRYTPSYSSYTSQIQKKED